MNINPIGILRPLRGLRNAGGGDPPEQLYYCTRVSRIYQSILVTVNPILNDAQNEAGKGTVLLPIFMRYVEYYCT
jgi:hypothetical protein